MLKFINPENEIYYNNMDVITVSMLQNFSDTKLLRLMRKNGVLFFMLDTGGIKDIDKIEKKIILLFQAALKNNIKIGKCIDDEKILGYVLEETSEKSKQVKSLFLELFKILDIGDIHKIYSYI